MNNISRKLFLVYRTTNILNGKTYIGCHETYDINDSYLGSGKLLKRAIEKYGRQYFEKDIIEVCSDRQTMFNREIYWIALLSPDYNLTPGGYGGFHYINKNKLNCYKDNRSSAGKKIGKILRDRAMERYYKLPKLCKHCTRTLPYAKRKNTFCSSSCAARANNTNRTLSDEARSRISNSLKGKYKTEKKRCKKCGHELRKRNITGYCRTHQYCISKMYNQKNEILKMAESMSCRQIGRVLGVSHVSVFKVIKQNEYHNRS